MKKAPAKCCFTLLELIVVMSIIFLASGMAMAVFREQSPAKRLETAAMQFHSFCAGVRYRAVESGKVRLILFDPQERIFRMYDPETEKEAEEESTEEESEKEETPFPKRQQSSNDLQWKLPEGFELGDFPGNEEEPDADNAFLLFTFYGDGSASGKRQLELRCGEDLGKIFKISALTGRLTVRELSENEISERKN